MNDSIMFYIDGVPVTELPMVQDGNGRYYMNASGAYFTPTMPNFYSAALPAGYSVYTDGSHVGNTYNGISQHPLDIAYVAGGRLTCNRDVRNILQTASQGSYCVVQYLQYQFGLVHTDAWASGTIKAGDTICRIKAMVGPHLHLFATINGNQECDVMNLLLNSSDTDTMAYPIGTRVKNKVEANIIFDGDISLMKQVGIARNENGTAIGEVSSLVMEYNGIRFLGVRYIDTVGWINIDGLEYASTTDLLPVTHSNGAPYVSVPTPPTVPIEVENATVTIKNLTVEIEGLKSALDASGRAYKALEEKAGKDIEELKKLSDATAFSLMEKIEILNRDLGEKDVEIDALKARLKGKNLPTDSVLLSRVPLADLWAAFWKQVKDRWDKRFTNQYK